MYVILCLSLAVMVGYLIRYSQVLRKLIGLPEDTVDGSGHARQSIDAATDPIGGFGCSHQKPNVATAATQTSVDHVPSSLTPPPPPPLTPPTQPPPAPSLPPPLTSPPLPSSVTHLPSTSHSPETRNPDPVSKSRLSTTTAVENSTQVIASCCQTSAERYPTLQQQVEKLMEEVERYKQVIGRIEAENGHLRERLAEQAKCQLTKGATKFENLSLGENRPSVLIKRYSDLYAEERIEAWDALDLLSEEIDDDSKEKLLFSIVVLCFRQSDISLDERLKTIREALFSSALRCKVVDSDGKAQLEMLVQDIEASVELYFRRTISRHDVSDDLQRVTTQLWSKLVDYPSLRDCESLLRFVEQCLKLAWALSVQNPAYVIQHDDVIYSDEKHTRFYNSDPLSNRILSYLWPALIEKQSGFCVSKGVVVT